MTNPTVNRTPAPATAPGRLPIDAAAVLAAMQDQIDDLTAVVETHQRRIDQLEQQLRARRG